MKKTVHKSTNSNTGNKVLVGVGLATLAAAAAGTYFLYGSKNAQKNRKIVRGWMLRAKGEIIEQMEAVKDMNEEMYHRIVQEVTDRYAKLKNIDMGEMKDFRDELKTHWNNIKKDMQGPIKGKGGLKTAGAGKSRSSKK
ncbi:MAG TPA: hypothetical protein VK145_02370 [Candidatus Nanoarchaeia archaeon]|nr:hypothetical protein [Candidatus Nanoarchaeia archaeon]